MKFCDKLVKMRKNNNMSQEQLADRLGISRQAVSKWESGQSIPDMAKILELCKILNCSLEDLVDDGVSSNKEFFDTKNNIHNYLKDFLDFITRTINMFWSMTLGEKIKCIIEMLVIAFCLYIVWAFVGRVVNSIFYNILIMLPDMAYSVIRSICSVIYGLFGVIMGLIIIIHVFKIRYLDYFITIEDSNTINKSIEEPVEELNAEDKDKEKKVKFIEKKKNKIIIRDPKHSTYTFFDFLGKIIIYIFKFMLAMLAIPCILSFVVMCFGTIFSIWLIKDGIFFLGITIGIAGLIIINYLVLKFIYNFIFNQKYKFNLLFIVFIVGLSLVGLGSGISFCNYLTFDKKDINILDVDYDVKEYELDINNNLYLGFLYHEGTEIITDDKLNNIKIVIMYNKFGEVDLYNYDHDVYIDDANNGENKIFNIYGVSYYNTSIGEDFIDEINYIIDVIKNKTRFNVSNTDNYRIKIYASSSNIEILKNNYELVYN